MSTRAGILLVVVVVSLTIAPLGSGAVVSPSDAGEESGESESNATVSTFMHASAAHAENTVESELFAAKYESADDETRATLVEKRTNALEERLAELEAEREELRERKGDLSTGKYRARMTKLTIDVSALERSIQRTKPRAETVGVGRERLETLDKNVSELTGREIAKTANSIPGFERAPGLRGSAGERGAASDRETGPPARAAGGQPNDAGNESNAKGGNGPPDDPGKQNGAGEGAEGDESRGNGTGNGGTGAPGGNTGSSNGAGADDGADDPATDRTQ